MPPKRQSGFINAQAGPSNAPSPGAFRGDGSIVDGDEAALANAPLPHPAEDLSADDDLLSWILVDQLGAMPGARLGVHPQQVKFVGPPFKTDEVLTIVHETVIKGDMTRAVERLLSFHLIQAHMATKRTTTQRERFTSHLRRYLLTLMPSCKIDIHTTDRYSFKTGHTELAIYATRPLTIDTVVDELQGSVVPLPDEWMTELDLGEEFLAREAAGEESESDSEAENQEKTKRMARRSDRTKRRDFSIVWSSMKKCYQLFLGPARFLNHDCDPNVELLRQGKYVTFKVKRHIRIGEEVTTYYGPNYFGKNNIECLCLTCEKRQVGGFTPAEASSNAATPAPPANRTSPAPSGPSRLAKGKASSSNLRNAVYPQSDEGDREDSLLVDHEIAASPSSSHDNSTSAPSLSVGKSTKDTDTTVFTPPDDLPMDPQTPADSEDGADEDDSGDESEESVAPRTKYERQATKKAKTYEWWRKKPKAKVVEPEAPLYAEDDDLPENFPRCATCAKPLMERVWFLGRYFDHCARCTRHALIFELPWPAHKHEDVQDYPPSHLIPNGYIPKRISTIPLPSLSKQPKKKLEPLMSPTDIFPGRLDAVSKEHRAAIRFRMEIYMEEFVVESLRTASWTEQEAKELAAEEEIRRKEEAIQRKEEAKRLREEEKRKRDEQFTKGTGLWSKYEIISDADYQKKILEKTVGLPVEGSRRRTFVGSYDENERKNKRKSMPTPLATSTTPAPASAPAPIAEREKSSASAEKPAVTQSAEGVVRKKHAGGRPSKSPNASMRKNDPGRPMKKRLRPEEPLEVRQARTQKARDAKKARRLAELAAAGTAGAANDGDSADVETEEVVPRRKRMRMSLPEGSKRRRRDTGGGKDKPRRGRGRPRASAPAAIVVPSSASEAEADEEVEEQEPPRPQKRRGRSKTEVSDSAKPRTPKKRKRLSRAWISESPATSPAPAPAAAEAIAVDESDDESVQFVGHTHVDSNTPARGATGTPKRRRARASNGTFTQGEVSLRKGKARAIVPTPLYKPDPPTSDSDSGSSDEDEDSEDEDFVGSKGSSSAAEQGVESEEGPSPTRRSTRTRKRPSWAEEEESSDEEVLPRQTRSRAKQEITGSKSMPELATTATSRSEADSAQRSPEIRMGRKVRVSISPLARTHIATPTAAEKGSEDSDAPQIKRPRGRPRKFFPLPSTAPTSHASTPAPAAPAATATVAAPTQIAPAAPAPSTSTIASRKQASDPVPSPTPIAAAGPSRPTPTPKASTLSPTTATSTLPKIVPIPTPVPVLITDDIISPPVPLWRRASQSQPVKPGAAPKAAKVSTAAATASPAKSTPQATSATPVNPAKVTTTTPTLDDGEEDMVIDDDDEEESAVEGIVTAPTVTTKPTPASAGADAETLRANGTGFITISKPQNGPAFTVKSGRRVAVESTDPRLPSPEKPKHSLPPKPTNSSSSIKSSASISADPHAPSSAIDKSRNTVPLPPKPGSSPAVNATATGTASVKTTGTTMSYAEHIAHVNAKLQARFLAASADPRQPYIRPRPPSPEVATRGARQRAEEAATLAKSNPTTGPGSAHPALALSGSSTKLDGERETKTWSRAIQPWAIARRPTERPISVVADLAKLIVEKTSIERSRNVPQPQPTARPSTSVASTPAPGQRLSDAELFANLGEVVDEALRNARKPRSPSTTASASKPTEAKSLPPLSRFPDFAGPLKGEAVLKKWQKEDAWSDRELVWQHADTNSRGRLCYRVGGDAKRVDEVALAKLAMTRMTETQVRGTGGLLWWNPKESVSPGPNTNANLGVEKKTTLAKAASTEPAKATATATATISKSSSMSSLPRPPPTAAAAPTATAQKTRANPFASFGSAPRPFSSPEKPASSGTRSPAPAPAPSPAKRDSKDFAKLVDTWRSSNGIPSLDQQKKDASFAAGRAAFGFPSVPMRNPNPPPAPAGGRASEITRSRASASTASTKQARPVSPISPKLVGSWAPAPPQAKSHPLFGTAATSQPRRTRSSLPKDVEDRLNHVKVTYENFSREYNRASSAAAASAAAKPPLSPARERTSSTAAAAAAAPPTPLSREEQEREIRGILNHFGFQAPTRSKNGAASGASGPAAGGDHWSPGPSAAPSVSGDRTSRKGPTFGATGFSSFSSTTHAMRTAPGGGSGSASKIVSPEGLAKILSPESMQKAKGTLSFQHSSRDRQSAVRKSQYPQSKSAATSSVTLSSATATATTSTTNLGATIATASGAALPRAA